MELTYILMWGDCTIAINKLYSMLELNKLCSIMNRKLLQTESSKINEFGNTGGRVYNLNVR